MRSFGRHFSDTTCEQTRRDGRLKVWRTELGECLLECGPFAPQHCLALTRTNVRSFPLTQLLAQVPVNNAVR